MLVGRERLYTGVRGDRVGEDLGFQNPNKLRHSREIPLASFTWKTMGGSSLINPPVY